MAGIWVGWLADAARLTGYPVVELVDWRIRGRRGLSAVEVVVCHHTAGPRTGEAPSLGVVRDGRAGLAGPLSHFVLGRSGTVYVVGAGVANHAGTSEWLGFEDLNSRSLGIEAEDDGDGTWTAEQLDCYPRLVAACLHYMRRDAGRAAGHREVAIDAQGRRGRKVDPAGIDMPTFRRQVAQLLTDPTRLIPRGGPPAAASTGGTAVATVRSEVWDAPIDDLYTDKGGDTLPAFAALAWANAHAARARGAAESADARAARIEAALARVEQKLDILLHRPTGPTVDVDASAITAAVQTAAAGVFGAGLDITGRATPARPALTEKGTPS